MRYSHTHSDVPITRVTLYISVQLPWPVNCFIKQSSLAEYSKVTTLLLRLKHAKHVLERHMLFGTENNMRLYALRMKLMWFVNTFWGYVMTTVRKTRNCARRVFV